MKRDPLKATVLATRYIPNATQKMVQDLITAGGIIAVSYTHLRAHETR